jgi:hypothetical protein
MPALKDWQSRLPRIRQAGRWWCIPASLEIMARYLGFEQFGQYRLVLDYCRRFGNDALLYPSEQGPRQVLIDGVPDGELIEIAKMCALKHANFDTFSPPLRDDPGFVGGGYLIEHAGGMTRQEHIAKIVDAMARNWPVLLSAKNSDGGYHICPIVEAAHTNMRVYDPADGRDYILACSDLELAADLLVIHTPEPLTT